DGADLKTSSSYYQLRAGQQTLTLHFASAEQNLKGGEQVEATGVVVGSEMAVLNASALPGGSGFSAGIGTWAKPGLLRFKRAAGWSGPIFVLLFCGALWLLIRLAATVRRLAHRRF